MRNIVKSRASRMDSKYGKRHRRFSLTCQTCSVIRQRLVTRGEMTEFQRFHLDMNRHWF